jgi:N6-adenosine-specific RNA methylase IME4
MKILVTDKQLKLIRESAPKEFSCEKCDHSWEIDKDDDHPYLCHMCGYESSNNEYNYEELEKFWKNFKREDLPVHTDPSKQIVSPSSKVISDICEKDCLIFMWSSSPHLVQALELMKGWGFEYKTVAFVWDKQKVNPGYYTMSQVELCLVGKRGKIPIRGSRNERQFLSEMRRSHSQKPDAVRDRIARMFPNVRKVELFARVATTGWSVWGNEVETNISI